MSAKNTFFRQQGIWDTYVPLADCPKTDSLRSETHILRKAVFGQSADGDGYFFI